MRFAVIVSLLALAIGVASCGPADRQDPVDPSIQPYTPAQPAEASAENPDLRAALAHAQSLDVDAFAKKYPVAFSTGLGYAPLDAKGSNLIQSSELALDAQERAVLTQRGFVISERQRFPSFVYGYQTLYLEDLPLFVSADSILYAVHESYDAILQALEEAALIPALSRLLESMRGALAAGGAGELPLEARNDADVHLAVAASLLAGEVLPPVAGGDPTETLALFDGAVAASGMHEVTLFGESRIIDFSQFTPRGHYTKSPGLQRYFRAMIWLGRIDFRFLEAQPDHTLVLHRRQIEGAYVLRALIDDAARKDWKSIDHTIESFVGEPDDITLSQLDQLMTDLGLSTAAGLEQISDQALAAAIVDGGYGAQRISSQIMVNGLDRGTLPASRAFLLFGQRYVLDSHVFSNVVYDRVQHGNVKRFLPDPLDVAFAAFGNNHAGQLLLPELGTWQYAPDLASMRILADAHPDDFWQANLYNSWLGMLRTLSPGPEAADPVAHGMPAVTGTEAWSRRLLQTQLASWAELRHDTLLYVKQSYTGFGTCEYPDAYVDPYPELYARLGTFADKGAAVITSLDLSAAPWLADKLSNYFVELGVVAATLESMAQHQRSGAPHSAEHLAFINRAVSVNAGCDGPSGFGGWYADLFFRPHEATELDPVIADVHTDPNQGHVLHVGTGMPRLIVVTAESCTGPRAYAGVVSSYFERVTQGLDRLDDQRWAEEVSQATPADVPWVQDFVVR